MTDDASVPERLSSAFDDHDAFDRTDGGFVLRTTAFDTRVACGEDEEDRAATVQATAWVPLLDEVVAGESVAAVVEDEWDRTLRRQLADAFAVAESTDHDEPRFERDDGRLAVTLAFRPPSPPAGPRDAKATLEYVEGTYAQGLISGYDYRGVAATLLDAAKRRGETGDETPEATGRDR